MNPVLTLVSGTRNRPEAYLRLLRSIEAHTPLDWELIVADASDVPLVYTEWSERVTVLAEFPRLGYVRGYNRCFKEARGEWIIYLNDDAEVMPGYAENAIAFMEAHPQIGLGALYYKENAGRWRVGGPCFGMIYANFGIIRKELGDRIGWFDEDLTMYGSDNSLTFRVLLAGLGVGSIENSRVLHHAVNDAERIHNETGKSTASHVLFTKYAKHKTAMQRVYAKTRDLAGPIYLDGRPRAG
jgi:GT2 family glycosyltransferase